VSKLEPGRVVAEGLGRRFKIAGNGGRSLRATLLRYQQAEDRDFWALRNVDLEIQPGETFGIVGRNGSGKSTLLKMLAKIFGPTEGWCDYGGRMSSMLELGAGFHPEFSAIENIYLSAAIYGIPKTEIEREIDSIIGFAELEEFANQPVKTFSSGMFARLGFSVAMHVQPDVLLLDEVFAVGDEAFVQKCLGRIAQYKRGGGTIILVTHDAGTVERLCNRATILERGEQVYLGSGGDAIGEYHQRLVGEHQRIDIPDAAHTDTTELDISVRILRDDAGVSQRFMEGEPITIEATLAAPQDIMGAQVALGLREANGFGFGNRTALHVDLKAEVPTRLRLHLPDPPMRQGLFVVGVRVLSEDGSEQLARMENLAEFSIFSRTPNAEGPILLRGDWSIL
jgi:ABC-2 type transport system ATP-binding protein